MANCEYLYCSSRKITSLDELSPGDHIYARGDNGILDVYLPELKIYAHHMLVVRVVDDSHIDVIHKKRDGVSEERRSYSPEEITLLEYDCDYDGDKAVQRARERMDEAYNLVVRNCEHFVTEVRTGRRQSIQVQTAVKVGVGAAIGVAVGTAVVAGLWYAFGRKGKKDDSDDSDDEEEEHCQTQYQYS